MRARAGAGARGVAAVEGERDAVVKAAVVEAKVAAGDEAALDEVAAAAGAARAVEGGAVATVGVAPVPEAAAGEADTFDVFISYSRRDRAFAAALESALQKYRPPRGLRARPNRLTVFRDEDDFTGSEYHESLQRNLQASSKLVVVCSPAARQSVYVNDEIRRFAAARQPRNVIPVLLSGIPNNEAAEDAAHAFPDALVHVLPLPLAVDYRGFDARSHKLARRPYEGSWFTLLANICDTSREEIEQRERSRARVRRVRIGTIAAVVLASAGFGLAKSRRALMERSRALAQLANEAVDRGSLDQALRFALLAMRGGWLPATVPEAEAALRRAAHASHHIATFKGRFELSPGGRLIATLFEDGTIRVSSIGSGEVLATITEAKPPRSVAFSPDGRFLATEVDRAVHVWEIATRMTVAELPADGTVIASVRFDPTGRLILVRTSDAKQLWEVPSGQLVATFPQPVTEDAVISPNGQVVLTAAPTGTVQLWDTSGNVLKTIEASTNSSVKGVFSPDSRTLLTFSTSDEFATLWNVDTGTEVQRLEWEGGPLSFAAFSPVGALLGLASLHSSRACLWDPTSGTPVAQMEASAQITSFAFSPDGAHLVAGMADGTARLWAVPSGLELTTLRGHTWGWMTASFRPDADRILTSLAGTSRLFSVRSGEVPQFLDGHTANVRSASFSRDGSLIVTASWDRTARVWDAASGRELTRLVGHTSSIAVATFDGEGRRVVTTSHDATARVWDAATGGQLAQLLGHEPVDEGEMRAGDFSPDGSLVVTASDDGTARVWRVDGKGIATLQGHTNAVAFAAFSPDGRLVVTASDDGTARLWWIPEGTLAATLTGHQRYVRHAAFSPDGALLATASGDGTARIWEVPSGRARGTLALHTDEVGQVQFSPDGTRIATASRDGTARIWTSRGEPMIRLDPRAGSVVSVAFSASGRLLATGSSDKVAHVWDVASGAELARFGRHETYIGSVAFNTDGTRLLTASGKTPRLYDVHWLSRPGGQSLVAAVCREKLRGIGRITEEDSGVLRGLRGRVGEEVCPRSNG